MPGERSLLAHAVARGCVGTLGPGFEHLFLAAGRGGVLVGHLGIGDDLAPNFGAVVGPDGGALEVPLAIAAEVQREASGEASSQDRGSSNQHALV